MLRYWHHRIEAQTQNSAAAQILHRQHTHISLKKNAGWIPGRLCSWDFSCPSFGRGRLPHKGRPCGQICLLRLLLLLRERGVVASVPPPPPQLSQLTDFVWKLGVCVSGASVFFTRFPTGSKVISAHFTAHKPWPISTEGFSIYAPPSVFPEKGQATSDGKRVSENIESRKYSDADFLWCCFSWMCVCLRVRVSCFNTLRQLRS